MSKDERRRWLAGRHDWREGSWQDHCGNLDCDHPGNCCNGPMPCGDPETGELRAAFERSILGAEVERL